MGRINNWLENLLMGSDLVYTPPSHDQPPVSKAYEISKQQNEDARKEREKEEQAEDDLKMVIQGAKLQCAMCVTPIGDLMVNFDTPSIQDKKTATIQEKDMTSLIFKGNCKKSPYSSSPCASVMQLGDWKDVGTSLVQDQPPLLLKSTIKCNYGGVDIKITDCGQRNEPEDINVVGAPVPVSEKEDKKSDLKKFIVHFRRGKAFMDQYGNNSDYSGQYGFDWLRDEYIYPIIEVTHDNRGTPIGVKTALCKDVAKLKSEYKDRNLSPYGKDYFPAWLSIFPHTKTVEFKHGSSMHKNGVDLDIEIEELEALVKDATELLFETNNKFLEIKPQKLNLKELLGKKKIKSLGDGNTRNYYLSEKKVNIRCTKGVLAKNEEIKVFAKLGDKIEEVGKLMLSKNDIIPKAEIVAINVISSANKVGLKADYQYLFKNQSFNQALIRAEVKVDTEFNLVELGSKYPSIQTFLNNVNTMSSEQIKKTLVRFYETYGKHKPTTNAGEINYTANIGTTKTYLFYTEFLAGNVLGSCSLDANNNWGNSYIIYKSALKNNHTIIHEAAHSLGLPHVFQGGSYAGKHTFYHGYTENYMDYTWQKGRPVDRNDLTKGYYSSGNNKFKNKMYSFYKWQWEEMRNDRSLILNY